MQTEGETKGCCKFSDALEITCHPPSLLSSSFPWKENTKTLNIHKQGERKIRPYENIMQLLSHNNNQAFNNIQQMICNGWWTNWNLMFILFFSSDWIKKSKKPADFAYFTQWPNFEAASSQTSQLPQFFHLVPQWGKSTQWHKTCISPLSFPLQWGKSIQRHSGENPPVPQWGKSVQWHRGEMNQTVQEIQHPWTSLVASILSHTVSVHYYNHYLYRYCHRQLVLVTFSQFHQPTCCFIYKGSAYWPPLGGGNKNLLAPPGGANKNLLAPPQIIF